MRYVGALILGLIVWTSPALAQVEARPGPTTLLTADGTFGIGQVYTGRHFNGRGATFFGLDMGFNVRYRRHAVGLRARAFAGLFGRPQLWESGGIYSFTLIGGLAVGIGVNYIFEVYREEATRDLVHAPRVGVPLEVTFRFQNLERAGPYVRAFANLNDERTFGGLSAGITL